MSVSTSQWDTGPQSNIKPQINKDFLPIEWSADLFHYHTIYFWILWLVHYCSLTLDFWCFSSQYHNFLHKEMGKISPEGERYFIRRKKLSLEKIKYVQKDWIFFDTSKKFWSWCTIMEKFQMHQIYEKYTEQLPIPLGIRTIFKKIFQN